MSINPTQGSSSSQKAPAARQLSGQLSYANAHLPPRIGSSASGPSTSSFGRMAESIRAANSALHQQATQRKVKEIVDVFENKMKIIADAEKTLHALYQAARANQQDRIPGIILRLPEPYVQKCFHAISLWHNMSDYEAKSDLSYQEAMLSCYPIKIMQEAPQTSLMEAPPFIHNQKGSLIDQLHCLIEREKEHAHLEKNNSLLRCISGEKKSECISHFVKQLDASVQKKLLDLTCKHFGLTNEQYPLHINKINDLIEDGGEISIAQKVRAEIIEEYTSRINEEKKGQFLQLYSSDLIGHKELKNYYNQLSDELKASTEIPSPPYYGKGIRSELYKTYGPQPSHIANITLFTVFAPSAQSVDLVIYGDHDVQTVPMKKITEGNWSVEKSVPLETKYQYRIVGTDGKERLKADPYARGSLPVFKGKEKTHYSIVTDDTFAWSDEEFIQNRTNDPEAPASIYEVHVGSWRVKEDGTKLNWKELANELGPYCRDMGYSHVEIFGALMHPDEKSWGYQPSGFFSVHEKLGTLKDFKYFINKMHECGIKVILDWVPGHFAIDNFSFLEFDGSHVFEHEDMRRNYQKEWDVYCFDFEKKYVRDFLISSANFFAKECHVDGLRVDAVTSMLYTSEGRSGSILPHKKGKSNHHGAIHSDAKIFFRDLNTLLHAKHKGFEVHAEESSGFDKLTASIADKDKGHPYSQRGLGFDKKWAMAAMHHSLQQYFRKNVAERDLDQMARAMQADGREYIVQVISHDETANCKGSLRSAMKGRDTFEKFANVRLFLTKMYATPGAKLVMAGCEIGQDEEWSYRFNRHVERKELNASSMDWQALAAPWPSGKNLASMNREMVKDLNKLYLSHPALSYGNRGEDFKWIKADDTNNHVMSFHRTSADQTRRVLCIQNFSDRHLKNYKVLLPSSQYDPLNEKITSFAPLFSSDDERYGGLGRRIDPRLIKEQDQVILSLDLPPSTAVILEEGLSS